MRTAVRLWRTVAGDLVVEGHRDADTLAYGENDNVENVDQAAAAKLQPKDGDQGDQGEAKAEAEHTPKADPKPAPKRRARKTAAAKK